MDGHTQKGLGRLDEPKRIQEQHCAGPGKNNLANHGGSRNTHESQKQSSVKGADDANNEVDDYAKAFAFRLGEETTDQTGKGTHYEDDERGIDVHGLCVTSSGGGGE
jgi:hypothetical protein